MVNEMVTGRHVMSRKKQGEGAGLLLETFVPSMEGACNVGERCWVRPGNDDVLGTETSCGEDVDKGGGGCSVMSSVCAKKSLIGAC
jgi:hypothetical protein